MDDAAQLEQYFADLAASAGTAPVTAAEAEELLDLARVVAHTSERKYAPLATYAAGLALDPAVPVTERVERLRAVRKTVQRSTEQA